MSFIFGEDDEQVFFFFNLNKILQIGRLYTSENQFSLDKTVALKREKKWNDKMWRNSTITWAYT